MAVSIVLTNQKGGVGKTTTSGAIAAGLSERGKKSFQWTWTLREILDSALEWI